MANQHLTIPAELGTIRISAAAVADLVARTAARCYGVVGLASKNRVGRMLGRERAGSAVEVSQDGGGIRIDLHVVVEYGLNLAEVAATLRSQVTYELERLTGLPVAAVDVHIENARRSE
ncbi:MAG: Asp23/Gls24 family envelope stress response protein [Gaiellaceae bacterium]